MEVTPNSTFGNDFHGPVYCEKYSKQVISGGVFAGQNPTHSTLPLLLLQLGLVSALSGVLHFILKPLGQPKQVTDLLSGIIIGPSVLGRNQEFHEMLFSPKSAMVLDVYETLSMVLFSFMIGLRTDLEVLKRAGRLALVMGITCWLLPLALNGSVLKAIFKTTKVEDSIRTSIVVVAGLEAMVNFHIVFAILTNHKLVNTDIGRTALSSSMISGICGWIFLVIRKFWRDVSNGQAVLTILTIPFSKLVLVLFIFHMVAPMMFWMIRQTPEDKTLKQSYVCVITILLFGVALYSEVNGIHPIFSSLLLGLAVPDGSSLQSGLVDKLEGFVSGVLMPSLIVNVGRRVDLQQVTLSALGYVELFVILAFLGKLLASMLTSIFWDIPLMDAFLVGLLVSCQGLFDIQFFSMAQRVDVLSTECFSIMVIMTILSSAVVTPLVRILYNPSRQYGNYKKRRIKEIQNNVEFEILACIHQEDNVPTLIDILEASNATRKSHIVVYVLDLVELVGQTIPLFISHKLKRNPSSRSTRTQRIIKAFYQYETRNPGIVNVHCFTSISPFATIHNDICLLALEKGTSLIMLSQNMSCGPSVRAMNTNVLKNAPCSVAILVDRRSHLDFRAAVRSWFVFHACLIFIGGADDREALVYGSRMCDHPSVNLTVIHITDINNDRRDLFEGKVDLIAINRFKVTNIDNDRVTYKVEDVREGTETVRVLQSLNGVDYDLLMVGRRHDPESPTMSGLVDWSEEDNISDFGIIGDILVSSDVRSKASVMIVQQHSSDEEHPEFQSLPHTPSRYNLQLVPFVDPDLEKCNSSKELLSSKF